MKDKRNNGSDTRRKRVYLSAPITGKAPALVRLKFEEMRRAVGRCHTPVCPLDLTDGLGHQPDYATCMGLCVEALLQCDAIYLARGWHQSRGCMAEFALARIYGKEVMFE